MSQLLFSHKNKILGKGLVNDNNIEIRGMVRGNHISLAFFYIMFVFYRRDNPG